MECCRAPMEKLVTPEIAIKHDTKQRLNECMALSIQYCSLSLEWVALLTPPAMAPMRRVLSLCGGGAAGGVKIE
jgi:hypothetical protein